MPILSVVVALAGCTQGGQDATVPENPQALMLRVAKQVQACWFKQPDPALKPYRMASEVNSYAGQPRILIVPRNRPEGLPKLVALAKREGGRTQFSTFGPLLAEPKGPRLRAALNRWAAGSRQC